MYQSNEAATATATVAVIVMIFCCLILIALIMVMLVAMWKIYTKAGEHGWAILVPVYNLYVLFKITFGSGWYCLLMLIPFVNIVLGIIAYVKLAKVFGKGGGFAIGLLFLPIIFIPLLAFSHAQYVGIKQNY